MAIICHHHLIIHAVSLSVLGARTWALQNVLQDAIIHHISHQMEEGSFWFNDRHWTIAPSGAARANVQGRIR